MRHTPRLPIVQTFTTVLFSAAVLALALPTQLFAQPSRSILWGSQADQCQDKAAIFNYVTNGDFDDGLANWDFTDLSDIGSFTAAYSPDIEALGRSDSGSLHLTWDLDLEGQFVREAIKQCLGPVPAGQFFRVGFAHMGDEIEGLSVRFYVGEDCSEGGAGFSLSTNESQDFEFVQSTLDLEDFQFESFAVRLRYEETHGAQQQGEAYLDKVFVREDSTVEPFVAQANADLSQGQVVRFDGSVLGGVSPFAPNFSWDFGDGEVSVEQDPLHTYALPGTYTVSLTADSGFEQAFDQIEIDVQAGIPAGCLPDAETLCIDDVPGDGRFEIQVAYSTVQGGGLSGAGQAIPLDSLGVRNGGLFWFFGPANPELLIKVLNGCAINDFYWIFYAAGTNVGLTVTVIDTITDEVWISTNPDLHAAPPVQDTSAMPCDS